MKKRRASLILVLALLVLGISAANFFFKAATAPTEAGPRTYLRFNASHRLGEVLHSLQKSNVIRSANAMRIYAWLHKRPSVVGEGTYQVRPGMSADEVLDALEHPVRHLLQLPESFWAARTGAILEQNEVTTRSEYQDLVKHPEEFKSVVRFPLPAKSLEGYLYPDTYDLPPLVGAKGVIERQLRNFEKKVWKKFGPVPNLQQKIIVASLVELEAGRGDEPEKVAGVIYNRLNKGMPLQVDASINYGLQKWRPLTRADYSSVISPYNLYLHKGLPPGPICSPTIRSINAALNPATHDYLYYVAMPDHTSLFAKTFAEHRKNVAKRHAALKALGADTP